MDRTHFKNTYLNYANKAKSEPKFDDENVNFVSGIESSNTISQKSNYIKQEVKLDKNPVGTTLSKDPVKQTSNVNEIMASATNVLIVCDGNPNDSVASAIALSLYIKEKFSKEPKLIFLGNKTLVDGELKEMYEIKDEIEKVVLKIELDYKDTQIESCEWYKDEVNKKLVFEIKPIHKGFGTKRINYKEDGLDYDLIITVGIANLADLGVIYKDNAHYFETVNIINIDNSEENIKYGRVNIIESGSEFISKIIFEKFIDWKFIPDINISRCLLIGLSGK